MNQRNHERSLESVPWDPKKYHPEGYALLAIDWFVIGSLTWSSARMRKDKPYNEWLRLESFKHVFRLTCSALRLRPKTFAYYQAAEWSDAKECHVHFAIAKAGLERFSHQTLASIMTTIWMSIEERNLGRTSGNTSRKRIPGAGTCLIEPIDKLRTDDWIRYICKRQFDASGREFERRQIYSKRLSRILLANAGRK